MGWQGAMVGQVLTADRAFTQLFSLGEDMGLLMWHSAGDQRSPDV
jgi:hypothetical protein